MAKMARRIEGIPVVANTTERDVLFPTPERDQRVLIRDGEEQRWNGTQWVNSPAFFAAQRAQGVHWVTDPTYDDSAITDKAVVLNAMVEAAAAGDTLVVPQAIAAASTVTVDKALTIEGRGRPTITMSTANTTLFSVTASDVKLRGLKMVGPQYASSQTNSRAVSATGTALAYLSGLHIEDCDMTTWGRYGVYMEFVEEFTITGNRLRDVHYAGILGMSVQRGQITGNRVENVVATGNAYGISVTKQQLDDLEDAPRSADIIISHNIVRDVTDWEGIDTHGGERITIAHNQVFGCKLGIAVVPADNGSNLEAWAPQDVKVIGNIVDSERDDGTAWRGIVFNGAYNAGTVEYATGEIIGNTVLRYSQISSNTDGAIQYRDTRGLKVSGNRVKRAGTTGICPYTRNVDFMVTDNEIEDPWTGSGASPACAIRVRDASNTGTISGNKAIRGTLSATNVLSHGIRIEDSSGNLIDLGRNDMNAATTPMFVSNLARLRTASHRLTVTVTSAMSPYTLPEYECVVLVDASGGAVTLNLPTIAATNRGLIYHIKKTETGANAVSVTPASGNGVDAAGSGVAYSIAGGSRGHVQLASNGTSQWYVISA